MNLPAAGGRVGALGVGVGLPAGVGGSLRVEGVRDIKRWWSDAGVGHWQVEKTATYLLCSGRQYCA